MNAEDSGAGPAVTNPASPAQASPSPPRSKRDELHEEWGFKNPATAAAMMKRARRLGTRSKPRSKRSRKSPLSKLLAVQRAGAGVHQHPRYGCGEHVHGSRETPDDTGPRPTQPSYQWAHDQHLVHSGLTEPNSVTGSDLTTVTLREIHLPSIASPQPRSIQPRHTSGHQQYPGNATSQAELKLPEITGRHHGSR